MRPQPCLSYQWLEKLRRRANRRHQLKPVLKHERRTSSAAARTSTFWPQRSLCGYAQRNSFGSVGHHRVHSVSGNVEDGDENTASQYRETGYPQPRRESLLHLPSLVTPLFSQPSYGYLRTVALTAAASSSVTQHTSLRSGASIPSTHYKKVERDGGAQLLTLNICLTNADHLHMSHVIILHGHGVAHDS